MRSTGPRDSRKMSTTAGMREVDRHAGSAVQTGVACTQRVWLWSTCWADLFARKRDHAVAPLHARQVVQCGAPGRQGRQAAVLAQRQAVARLGHQAPQQGHHRRAAAHMQLARRQAQQRAREAVAPVRGMCSRFRVYLNPMQWQCQR